MSKAKVIKCVCPSILPLCVFSLKSSKTKSATLFRMYFKFIFTEPIFQGCFNPLCIIFILNNAYKSSQPQELPPKLLTEPNVNLSAHSALIVQSLVSDQFSRNKINMALYGQFCPASILLWFYVLSDSCISS